jgi:hypothetical protein
MSNIYKKKNQISIEQMSFDEKIYSLKKIENFSKFKKPIEIKKIYIFEDLIKNPNLVWRLISHLSNILLDTYHSC